MRMYGSEWGLGVKVSVVLGNGFQNFLGNFFKFVEFEKSGRI